MKFTDEEVDTLIEILNEEVGVRFEDGTFDEYYDKAVDLTQAITQLHFSDEIESPDIRKKVIAIIKDHFIRKIQNAESHFVRRNKHKIKHLSYAKSNCEDAARHLGILIKLETQEETDKEIRNDTKRNR